MTGCSHFLLYIVAAALCVLLALPSSAAQSSDVPSIYRISGCVDVGNTTVDCRSADLPTVTIYGSGFTNATSMLVTIGGGPSSTIITGWQVNMQAQTFTLTLYGTYGLPNGVLLNVTVSINDMQPPPLLLHRRPAACLSADVDTVRLRVHRLASRPSTSPARRSTDSSCTTTPSLFCTPSAAAQAAGLRPATACRTRRRSPSPAAI
jgi:hypothetical protein